MSTKADAGRKGGRIGGLRQVAKGLASLSEERRKEISEAGVIARNQVLQAKPIPMLELGEIERFWSRVDRSQDGCWLWKRNVPKRGYPSLKVRGVQLAAHRVAYVIQRGSFDWDLDVCHTCDTPACMRGDHFFLGTHLDNMRDSKMKGRRPSGETHQYRINPTLAARGEKIGRASITEEEVKTARRLRAEGVSLRSIAKKLNCRSGTVSYAVRGLTWKHVSGPIQKGPIVTAKITQEIADNIRRERIEHGTSLTTLAKNAGLSQPVVASILSGRLWCGGDPSLLNKASRLPPHPGSRFSVETVREVRRLHKEGVSYSEIAERCDMTQSTAANIVARRTWKHID